MIRRCREGASLCVKSWEESDLDYLKGVARRKCSESLGVPNNPGNA
jgi:hypothetical protein